MIAVSRWSEMQCLYNSLDIFYCMFCQIMVKTNKRYLFAYNGNISPYNQWITIGSTYTFSSTALAWLLVCCIVGYTFVHHEFFKIPKGVDVSNKD